MVASPQSCSVRIPFLSEPILRSQYGRTRGAATGTPQSLIIARNSTPQKMTNAVVGQEENWPLKLRAVTDASEC